MPERRLPIIGSNNDPSLIEAVVRSGLEAAGMDVVVERWEPRPHLLGDSLGKLRNASYLGALVRSPHKERAATLITALSDDAKVSGALNVIVHDGARLRGHNTDVDGIRAGLTAILPRVHGRWPRRAVVLGAGGGARAAVTVLISEGLPARRRVQPAPPQGGGAGRALRALGQAHGAARPARGTRRSSRRR